MTEADVVALLRAEVEKAGGMRALAREWGCSVSYVSDVLNHRRAPGPTILDPMGVDAVRTLSYELRTPCPPARRKAE